MDVTKTYILIYFPREYSLINWPNQSPDLYQQFLILFALFESMENHKALILDLLKASELDFFL